MLKAILVIILSASLSAWAGDPNFWLEAKTTSTTEKTTPQIRGGINGSFTESFGYFEFTQITESYAQAYAGPTWKIVPWLELGLALGAEEFHRETTLRKAGYLWLGAERFSALVNYETGGSGAWHKITLNYATTDQFGLGLVHDRFLGLGPKGEYRPNKTLTWGATLFQKENKRSAVFNIQYKF